MYMRNEHAITEKYFPGLIDDLKKYSFTELENDSTQLGIDILKKHGVGRLIISQKNGGLEAPLKEAIAIHRMIGSLAPSMSIQLTMHNFTTSILGRIADIFPYSEGFLRSVSSDKLLLASGFAEGKPGASILDSSMIATPVEGGYRISGTKMPCTLSHHMDYLTAGVAIVDGDEKYTGLAIIDPSSPGIEIDNFWKNPVLSAADSHKVTLNDVFIDQEAILIPDPKNKEHIQAVALSEITGIGYFQILMSASYLGIASALVRKVMSENRGDKSERTQLLLELESASHTLQGASSILTTYPIMESELSQLLLARYSVQQAIQRATNLAMELIGGLPYITGFDTTYLLSASRAIAFHPISRKQAEDLIISSFSAS